MRSAQSASTANTESNNSVNLEISRTKMEAHGDVTHVIEAILVMMEKNARSAHLARFKTRRAKQVAKSVCQGPFPSMDGIHAMHANLGSTAQMANKLSNVSQELIRRRVLQNVLSANRAINVLPMKDQLRNARLVHGTTVHSTNAKAANQDIGSQIKEVLNNALSNAISDTTALFPTGPIRRNPKSANSEHGVPKIKAYAFPVLEEHIKTRIFRLSARSVPKDSLAQRGQLSQSFAQPELTIFGLSTALIALITLTSQRMDSEAAYLALLVMNAILTTFALSIAQQDIIQLDLVNAKDARLAVI